MLNTKIKKIIDRIFEDKNSIKKYKQGFTLVEALVYAVGTVLLIGVIVGLMYYMYNWYEYATISSKVDQLGLTLVDRVVRDIRTGTTIDLSKSDFGIPTGSIFINAKVNGVDTTEKISLSGGRIQYQENGGVVQYLSPTNMSASRLLFTSINTGVSQAVRVELEITYTTRTGPVTHDFDGLAILRQSYE